MFEILYNLTKIKNSIFQNIEIFFSTMFKSLKKLLEEDLYNNRYEGMKLDIEQKKRLDDKISSLKSKSNFPIKFINMLFTIYLFYKIDIK